MTRAASARRLSWRRLGSAVSTAALALLIGGWAVFFRPTFLHGTTGYVIVTGTSMQPSFRSGDLVVTTPRPSYRIGDVVAYRVRPPGSHAERFVIHRIVGGDAERGFVMRGDNRSRHDLWRPKPAQILGAEALHVPRVGLVLATLQKPKTIAALLAGALVFMAIMRLPAGRPRPVAAGAPSTHLVLLPSPRGYTLIEQRGAPPRPGMQLAVGGVRLLVVRDTASPYPHDPRRCAVLVEAPRERAPTPQQQEPWPERQTLAA